ncbi:MAG TPA: hypothetical protein VGG38_20375 [Acidimicrobiales bacterium]
MGIRLHLVVGEAAVALAEVAGTGTAIGTESAVAQGVPQGAVPVVPARAAGAGAVSPNSSDLEAVEAVAVAVKAAGSDLLAAVKAAVVDGTARRRPDDQNRNPLSWRR